jgi:hypothetical protein
MAKLPTFSASNVSGGGGAVQMQAQQRATTKPFRQSTNIRAEDIYNQAGDQAMAQAIGNIGSLFNKVQLQKTEATYVQKKNEMREAFGRAMMDAEKEGKNADNYYRNWLKQTKDTLTKTGNSAIDKRLEMDYSTMSVNSSLDVINYVSKVAREEYLGNGVQLEKDFEVAISKGEITPEDAIHEVNLYYQNGAGNGGFFSMETAQEKMRNYAVNAYSKDIESKIDNSSTVTELNASSTLAEKTEFLIGLDNVKALLEKSKKKKEEIQKTWIKDNQNTIGVARNDAMNGRVTLEQIEEIRINAGNLIANNIEDLNEASMIAKASLGEALIRTDISIEEAFDQALSDKSLTDDQVEVIKKHKDSIIKEATKMQEAIDELNFSNDVGVYVDSVKDGNISMNTAITELSRIYPEDEVYKELNKQRELAEKDYVQWAASSTNAVYVYNEQQRAFDGWMNGDMGSLDNLRFQQDRLNNILDVQNPSNTEYLNRSQVDQLSRKLDANNNNPEGFLDTIMQVYQVFGDERTPQVISQISRSFGEKNQPLMEAKIHAIWENAERGYTNMAQYINAGGRILSEYKKEDKDSMNDALAKITSKNKGLFNEETAEQRMSVARNLYAYFKGENVDSDEAATLAVRHAFEGVRVIDTGGGSTNIIPSMYKKADGQKVEVNTELIEPKLNLIRRDVVSNLQDYISLEDAARITGSINELNEINTSTKDLEGLTGKEKASRGVRVSALKKDIFDKVGADSLEIEPLGNNKIQFSFVPTGTGNRETLTKNGKPIILDLDYLHSKDIKYKKISTKRGLKLVGNAIQSYIEEGML